ncbi:helix-turn-helix domain-containing protein [Virgibacillus necropolis]|uniref:helix-turn-helix domain-containing protein n=1 Tax=Virgibacillus necropolis TaxID=163877 RepID=UPI0038516D1D
MLTDGIILKSSLHFDQNRTCSAIFHLITGKKSIQTVQDAHIYQLKNLYGINRSFHKREFDRRINTLVSNHLLELDESMSCSVTSSGKDWLKEQYHYLKLNDYDGLQYHTAAPIFYDRLLLLIQTLSNSCNNHYSFIPVIERTPILQWVKVAFKQLKLNKKSFSNQLQFDLHKLLKDFSDEEASIYVDRLSGFNHYGRSKDQLALDYQKDKLDISFIIERMNHAMLNKIYSDPHGFPAIGFLITDLRNKQFITNSASKTYQLLQENYSISEIGQMRRLKENTVYDHVVEVALFTHDFPVSNYVSEDQQQQILLAVSKECTYKLKAIKQMVDLSISYFQIRLVLATMQHVGEHYE